MGKYPNYKKGYLPIFVNASSISSKAPNRVTHLYFRLTT